MVTARPADQLARRLAERHQVEDGGDGQHDVGHGERRGDAGVDQFDNAIAQRKRRAGDEHTEGRDQRPEVGFPPVPQGMAAVRVTGAATLRDEEEQVVGGIRERMRCLGGHGGRPGEDRRADLGERDAQTCPEGYQYGPRAVVRHNATSTRAYLHNMPIWRRVHRERGTNKPEGFVCPLRCPVGQPLRQ
jgi:hypothetical protein